MKVVIIDYGAGNIFSVQKAFERLGVSTILTTNLEEIENASHVIFPGVGHAKAAMEQLKKQQLIELIPNLKQPVLGICLGMQLLCDFTEEGNIEGLGVFSTKIKHFKDKKIVPQMGWNDVEFDRNMKMTIQSKNHNHLSGAYYFVHSYRADLCENTWSTTNYENETFTSSLKKDNFIGVQFHPEKSGKLGEQFLIEFLKK